MSGREELPGDATRPEPEEIPPESTEYPLEASGSASDIPPVRPRRRRRANPEPRPKAQSFYFVDSNSSSKEKRAHVMRHHVQEKRKLRQASTGSIPFEHMQEITSWQARKDSGYDTDSQRDSAVSSTPYVSTDQDSSLPIRFSYPYSLPGQPDTPMSTSTSSRKPSASSVMAFYHPDDQELVGYWDKISYWSGGNAHIKNQIFQTASEHPVVFHMVIMTYCARYYGHIENQSESEIVQRHLNQARQYLLDATTGYVPLQEDHLGFAIAGMALHEHRFGKKDEARGYLDHACRILRPRTGCNTQVEAFLHYILYLLPLPPTPITIEPAAQQFLVTFLWEAEGIMREHSTPEFQAQAPQRPNAFAMNSPLFPLLSSGPRPSEVPVESRMYVLADWDTQEVSRTVSLITITAAFWDFKGCASKTGRFLAYLGSVVEQHQLDRHPACETLMWLLLEQGYDGDLRNAERPWLAGELLRTHKQLRPDLQFLFNEILMSFLTLREPIRGIDVFERELRTYTSSLGL